MEQRFLLNKDVLINDVQEQGILTLLHDEEEELFYVNETAISLVVFIASTPKTIEEIIQYLVAEYDVSQIQCREDVLTIISNLTNSGLLDCV